MAKKMMADLGLGRRDLVTAPDDERKLRDAQAIAARARERAAVQQTVKAHRARVAKATIAKGDDDRTARIKKWSGMYALLMASRRTNTKDRSNRI